MDEVTKATQSLQEIANLQSTMAFHLTAQQEVIQSIHQDAMDSVANMSLANQQLKKTDKIFGQARLWIFVFLVGASFVLLFLDYYG
jgi:syntaxin 18